MSLEVFRAGLSLAEEYEDQITLGGGEPTLHPLFEQFLLEAMVVSPVYSPVFIVTNGSIKNRALMLLKLSVRGAIDARLSHDQYHDRNMVADEVFEGFEEANKLWGGNGADNYRRSVFPQGRGRALDNAMDTGCSCPDTHLYANGNLHFCGCDDAPYLGHVLGDHESYPLGGICWKDEEAEDY